MVQVLTFGHGTATQDEIIRLLGRAGVRALVDVRSAPGSRRHPHVARAELERWLPEQGIAYRWDRRLGGFRKLPPDSPDSAWSNDAFRAYAAHMRTTEFCPQWTNSSSRPAGRSLRSCAAKRCGGVATGG